jgi:hypothetical protein
MKKTFNVLAVILISCTLAAWGLTTVTGQHLINSVIDSTSIGSTTPSTGSFTALSSFWSKVTSVPPSSLPSNQMVLGWNATSGGGEGDFVTNHGSGGQGGFSWFDTGVSQGNVWSASSPLMTLNKSGALATSGGFVTSSTVTANGGFFGNLNGNATSATTANSANTANTANSANTANTATSANSANVLNSPVFNCGPTVPATGIQTNGNANCGSYPGSFIQNGYTTLPGGAILQWGNSGTFNTGPVTVALPKVFPHACMQAMVGDASAGSRIQSLVGCSQSSITIRNDGTGVATYFAIGY